jgi:hypothetical protein
MASRAAIATMNDLAFKRLYRAMADISEAFPEVEPATLPSFRDIRYQEAARYDALASWAERLAVAMGVSSVPVVVEEVEIVEDEIDTDTDTGGSKYSDMSNRQLRRLADERGINTAPLRSKAELIDALQAADGFTEDEQQQMDEALDNGEAS